MSTIHLNRILNDIATCNFYFSVSDYVCTLLLKKKKQYYLSSVIIIHATSPGYDNNLLLYGSANLPDKIEF